MSTAKLTFATPERADPIRSLTPAVAVASSIATEAKLWTLQKYEIFHSVKFLASPSELLSNVASYLDDQL